MKKRIFASALAAVMALSLCACGGNAASGAAASTGSAGSAAPEETKAAQEVTTAEAASTEEASTEASTAQYDAIEYPIEGDHSFTMTSVKRMNVAEALGDKDYSATISYEALEKATGVHIDFEMLAETSYEETLNLRMASQDYPDIFSQSVASYQQKLEKAID